MRIGDYHSGKNDYTRAYDKELKPIPIETPTRLYGMEIELEFNSRGYGGGYDRERVASDLSDDITDNPELDGTFHLERDGSLSYGFEVITHPMEADGFDKWVENPMITNLLDKSYDSGHNGIHVHCTRMANDTIYKIAFLMTILQDRLANRTRSSDYARWYNSDDNEDSWESICSFYRHAPTHLTEQECVFRTFLKLDLMGKDFDTSTRTLSNMLGDRYQCVNNQNSKTIEFRFFNYTSETTRLKKYIRFVESLMDIQSKYTLCQLAKVELKLGSDFVVEVIDNTILADDVHQWDFITEAMQRKMVEKDNFENAFSIRTVALPIYNVGDFVFTDLMQMESGQDQFGLGYSDTMSNDARSGNSLEVLEVYPRTDSSYSANYIYELSNGFVYNASWISGLSE